MKRDAYGSPFPRLSAALDRLYRRVWRLPACGPGGCYCRRTCSWMVGISPDRWRAMRESPAAVAAYARDARLTAAQRQPAEGEEVMVNTPYDVFTLPLHPSGLSSGPRFVVHVPGPEAQAAEDQLIECAFEREICLRGRGASA